MAKVKTKQIENFVLDSLTDVDNTTSEVGDILRYNGSTWEKYDQKDGMIEVYTTININLATGPNPTAWTDMTWDTQDFIGSIYNHTISGSDITFLEEGYYELEYSVSIDNTSSSSRSSLFPSFHKKFPFQTCTHSRTMTSGGKSNQEAMVSVCLRTERKRLESMS